MTEVIGGVNSEPPEYVFETVKCFLCDREFLEGEVPRLMFERRFQDNGQEDCPISTILSSALGRVIEENTTHSQLLCNACNGIALEYESIEHRYYEIRYKILTNYNTTAKRNNLDLIVIEVDGVVEDLNETTTSDNFETVYNHETADVVDDKLSAGTEIEEDADSDLIEEENEAVVDQNDMGIENQLVNNNKELCNSNASGLMISEIMAGQSVEQQQMYSAEEGVGIHAFKIHTESKFSDKDNVPTSIVCVDVAPEDIIYEQVIDHTSEMSYEEQQESCDNQSMHDYNSSSAVEISSTNDQKRISRISRQIKDTQPLPYQLKNNMYYCLVCPENPEFEPKLFPTHLRSWHNYRFFICDFCNKGFTKRQDLNDHMDEGHGNGEEIFNCDVCLRNFDNYRLFRIHKRQHYTSSSKHFECELCNKRYSSNNLLNEHMNMHTGRRPFKCEKCTKDFASKYTLQAHAKIHTDRQRPFQCTECEKAFFNQQNLLQHKKIHLGVKSFICDICSKPFGTQHNLDVHKIVHSGNKPFICRMCDKAFARRAEIRDHERTHTGERPFACDLCPMAFAQRSNLSTHKKTTHLNDKRHKCNVCDRSFKRRRLLEYHKQSAHTGERPYKCDICSSTFVYPEHFKKHMLIHSGIKPYACEVCGKQFNSRDNRNAHRFTHSKKKPYECLQCGAGFMRKPLLLTHMRNTKHNNDTIIINKPQISVPEFNSNTTLPSDDSSSDHLVENIVVSNENGANIKSETPCEMDGYLGENYEEGNDDVSSVAQEFIKDEMGEIKYLQFSEMDKDGKHTLTWVDIGEQN